MKTGTQRFRKTVVARALITAFCGTATMMIAQETLAQTSTGSTLQRVEVTGSNIRRTDTETASPVQVITKEEIDVLAERFSLAVAAALAGRQAPRPSLSITKQRVLT